MVISRDQTLNPRITVAGASLERVQRYKYLGSWVNEAWESDNEIKARIEIARASFNKMKKVLCNKKLDVNLRVRMLQCYIWPIVFYGCEAWTIKEHMRQKLEALEMWFYRRMLQISWVQRVRNDEVLRRVKKSRELMKNIKRRKVAYLGHVLRYERYHLLQTIMMGKIEGKRRVGRRNPNMSRLRRWSSHLMAKSVLNASLWRIPPSLLQNMNSPLSSVSNAVDLDT